MRDRIGQRYPHQNAPTPIAATVMLVAVAVLVGSVTVVFVLGFAEETPSELALATFEFDYDPDGQTLAITHAGGSALRADQLHVRGRGIVASGNDSRWSRGFGGEATGRANATSAVVAGDTAIVGVESDYVVRVVLIHPDEDRSTVLGVDRGPDA